MEPRGQDSELLALPSEMLALIMNAARCPSASGACRDLLAQNVQVPGLRLTLDLGGEEPARGDGASDLLRRVLLG